jgi:hypothetical protein
MAAGAHAQPAATETNAAAAAHPPVRRGGWIVGALAWCWRWRLSDHLSPRRPRLFAHRGRHHGEQCRRPDGRVDRRPAALVFGSVGVDLGGGAVAWVMRGFRRLHAPYADRGLPDWVQGLGWVLLILSHRARGAAAAGLASVLPGGVGRRPGRLIAQPLTAVLGFTAASCDADRAGRDRRQPVLRLLLAHRGRTRGAFFEALVQRARDRREARKTAPSAKRPPSERAATLLEGARAH